MFHRDSVLLDALELEAAPEPTFRPPKALKNQAADRMALFILKLVLPRLKVAFDYSFDYLTTIQKRRLLDPVKKTKDWYWTGTTPWLGHVRSGSRYIMSNSFMDVLDWKKALKRTNPIFRFLIQVFFCCEAGHIENWEEEMLEPRECKLLVQILRFLDQLYLTTFYSTSIRFMDMTVIYTIFQLAHTNLLNVHLHLNIDETVFRFLGLLLSNLKNLSLDLENKYFSNFDNLEEHIYKAFFKKSSKTEVLECVRASEHVDVCFSNLKSVTVKYDAISQKITELMCCLHECYPKIRTTLTCLSPMLRLYGLRGAPFVLPSLIVDKNDEFRQISLSLRNKDYAQVNMEYNNTYEGFILCWSALKSFWHSMGTVQQAMASITDQKFYYLHIAGMSFALVSELCNLAETLTELCIFGGLNSIDDERNLVLNLNKCKKLKVLTIFTYVTRYPDIKLNEMPFLEVLIIKFYKYLPMSYTLQPTSEWWPNCENQRKKFLMQIIQRATNLKYLELPEDCHLDDLVELDNVSNIHTLTIHHGTVGAVCQFLRKLPSLSKLVLSDAFSYKDYLRIKKIYKCSNLSIVYRMDRFVAPFLL